MIKATVLPLAAAMALLAGCMPVPEPGFAPMAMQPPAMMQPVAPVAPIPPVAALPAAASGISGLQERKPDLCHAKDYSQYLSQPASVISTLGLTKTYRIAEYRGIEPQDYDPNRIVFRLDAAGNINNIDCG